MTKKIFRSIVLVAACALLASLLLIMGCLYAISRVCSRRRCATS